MDPVLRNVPVVYLLLSPGLVVLGELCLLTTTVHPASTLKVNVVVIPFFNPPAVRGMTAT